jgi:6-phosphogluconolactonase (cycloisomerase 2 family)
MHRLARLAAALGVALTLALAGAAAFAHTASAHGDEDTSSSPGFVYVNDNTTGVNTIAGFARHADGSLTPLPGSPFAAGGAGRGTGVASQGSIQVTSDGRYLLVADAGSNQISVLHIAHDGSLSPVAGSSFASGGVEPVSIAVHDHLVYVANAGNSGSNYTGFTLSTGGRLTPIPGSTFSVPDGAGLVDVLLSPDGTRLAGIRVGTTNPSTFLIDSFAIGEDGRITAASGSPFTAQSAGPFGSAFRPTSSAQLFVSNAHAGSGNGTISAFHVAHDGTLTSIGASPYPDFQTAPCWLDITPNGRYLFAVNTASTTISRFAIAPDGRLSLLGSTPFTSGVGIGSVDIRVAPDGRTAYVLLNKLGAVAAFAVDGGSLTELTSSPAALPAGATPFGIAVAEQS